MTLTEDAFTASRFHQLRAAEWVGVRGEQPDVYLHLLRQRGLYELFFQSTSSSVSVDDMSCNV